MNSYSLFLFIYVPACVFFADVQSDFPFNDPSLPWDKRVDDLVNRLTVDEITEQMAYGGRLTYAPGISRLGIKPYPWGSECLRGDISAGPATSFPQAIGLAATFSKEVIFNMSRATGLEVRAKYNNYSAHGDYGQHTSASCWSPVINIMRDPRWGRNQETYGEDPFMSGLLSKMYVYGLQGNNSRYVMANAGCKHFDVYAGPENIPESRHKFNAVVSETDWRMTFLPAFKACVDAGTYSLMCSYNRVNGVPACANKLLLTDILRGEWGFQGYVISDEGAIEDIMDNHHYTHSIADTAAAAVNAGCNLEDGPGGIKPYFLGIKDAVNNGSLSESVVREGVKPLFYTRMRLGLFDPPHMNPYSQLDPAKLIDSTFVDFTKVSALAEPLTQMLRLIVQSAEHRELAITSAMRSYVLLKNDANFLPFKAGHMFGTLAVVGPMGDQADRIFGEYAPDPDPAYVKTPRQGLSPIAQTTRFAAGCNDMHCDMYDSKSVKDAVTGADLTVVCLGTGAELEMESNDRSDIELPGNQSMLLQDVVNAAASKPVILLLFNAGPLNITWAIQNSAVPAIIACFFPAQGTGEALRRVFYNEGEAANPAARLPATWPMSLDGYPAMVNYTMIGRTYRYSESEPMFPFGYGLSYTSFMYSNFVVPTTVQYRPGGSFNVSVTVKNTGPYSGEEVVQVYTSWTNTSMPGIPKLQLVSFERVLVPVNTSVNVRLEVSFEPFQVWDVTNKMYTVLKGDYSLFVGGQQPFVKVQVGSNVLKASFSIQ